MDIIPSPSNHDSNESSDSPIAEVSRRERLSAFWRDHGGQIELGIIALWAALAGAERYKMRKSRKISTRY